MDSPFYDSMKELILSLCRLALELSEMNKWNYYVVIIRFDELANNETVLKP